MRILKQETTIHAHIPKIAARAHVLCSKMLFELVRIADVVMKICNDQSTSFVYDLTRRGQRPGEVPELIFGASGARCNERFSRGAQGMTQLVKRCPHYEVKNFRQVSVVPREDSGHPSKQPPSLHEQLPATSGDGEEGMFGHGATFDEA